MRRSFLLCLILFWIPAVCLALFEETTTDARNFALAGAWPSGREGWDADLSCPAVHRRPSRWGLAAGGALPYGLPDLAAASSAGYMAVGPLTLGLGLNSMGSGLYRESRVKAVAAYDHRGLITAGAALNLFHLAIRNYGSAIAVGLDGGLAASPSRYLSLGLVVNNINRPKMGQASQELAQEMMVGGDYHPLSWASSSLGLRMQRGWPAQLRVGQEFWILPHLALRFGYQNRPGALSGGFGLRFLSYALDYAVRTHPALGLSHCLSLSYTMTERDTGEVVGEKRAEAEFIHLNQATGEELCLLPGLGKKKASAIVAYRDSVGGFNHLDDLLAVRGVTLKWLRRIAPYVDLSFRPGAAESGFPININRATVDELCRLPGIGAKTAEAIVNFRQQSRFLRPEDLMKVKGIGRKTFERIRSLIIVEDAGQSE